MQEFQQDIQISQSFNRNTIVQCFENWYDQSANICAKLSNWGITLSKAKKLRENSNYEGLLITHEYNHVMVTECFENLVSVLAAASETILPEAICFFKNFLDAYQRREHWYAFLNWEREKEGLYYLEDSLLNKVKDRKALFKVARFLSPLRQAPNQSEGVAEQVQENIKMGVFGGKSRLMNDFRNKINQLQRHLQINPGGSY
jgi:hypothetical protein